MRRMPMEFAAGAKALYSNETLAFGAKRAKASPTWVAGLVCVETAIRTRVETA